MTNLAVAFALVFYINVSLKMWAGWGNLVSSSDGFIKGIRGWIRGWLVNI
jgi:hypothetical protein